MNYLSRIPESARTPEDWAELREEQEGRDDEEQINECGVEE